MHHGPRLWAPLRKNKGNWKETLQILLPSARHLEERRRALGYIGAAALVGPHERRTTHDVTK